MCQEINLPMLNQYKDDINGLGIFTVFSNKVGDYPFINANSGPDFMDMALQDTLPDAVMLSGILNDKLRQIQELIWKIELQVELSYYY